jgi:hypothetical protein
MTNSSLPDESATIISPYPARGMTPHQDFKRHQTETFQAARSTLTKLTEHGLLAFVTTPEQFAAHTGLPEAEHAADLARVPASRPLSLGTTTAAIAIDAREEEKYRDYEVKLARYKFTYWQSLSVEVCAHIDKAHGDCHLMSLRAMGVAVAAKFKMGTADDIDRANTRLATPLTDGSPAGVSSHVVSQNAILRYLEDQGQQPTPLQQVTGFIKTVSTFAAADGSKPYAAAAIQWRIDNPDLSTQTHDSITTIISELANILAITAPAARTMDFLYGNAAHLEDDDVPPLIDIDERTYHHENRHRLPNRQRLVAQHYAHVANNPPPARPPTRPQPARTGRAPARTVARAAPAVQLFCHTHGWCSHESSECLNPAPGHRTDVRGPTAEHPSGITGRYRRSN